MADLQNQQIDPIYRGEDVSIPHEVTGVNITGWALRWTLAEQLGGPPVLAVTTAGGITITDGTAGEFAVALTAAQTAVLTPPDAGLRYRTHYWDVWRTDSGSRRRLAGGTVRVGDPEAAYP